MVLIVGISFLSMRGPFHGGYILAGILYRLDVGIYKLEYILVVSVDLRYFYLCNLRFDN